MNSPFKIEKLILDNEIRVNKVHSVLDIKVRQGGVKNWL